MCRVHSTYFHVVLLLFIFLMTIFGRNNCFAQDTASLKEAIYFAAKGKYPKAKKVCQEILRKHPDNMDVTILLGRLYSWNQQFDSARIILQKVLDKDSNNIAALTVLTNVELWSNNPSRAIMYSNKVLQKDPSSYKILLKKAKALYMLGKVSEAHKLTAYLLKNHPESRDPADFLKYLNQEIIPGTERNGAGITFSNNSFNRTYSPWNYFSLYYFNKNKLGAVIGSVNYASRFNMNGIQYEVNLYPHLTSGMYAYVHAGYSGSVIFPRYSLGAALHRWFFKNSEMFKDLELSLGVRYLDFTILPSPLIIYTGSVSLYYNRFWMSFTPYIIPQNVGADQSYYLIMRYYFHNRRKNLSLTLNAGLFPQNYFDLALHQSFKDQAKTKGIKLEYRTIFFSPKSVLKLSMGYEERKYIYNTKLNRITTGVGFERLF